MASRLQAWLGLSLLCTSMILEGSTLEQKPTDGEKIFKHVAGVFEPRLHTSSGSAPANNHGSGDFVKHMNNKQNGYVSPPESADMFSSDQIKATSGTSKEIENNTGIYASNKTDTTINTQDSTSHKNLPIGVTNIEDDLFNVQLPSSFRILNLKDKFRCSPCNCYRTMGGRVIATCDQRESYNKILSALQNDTFNLTISNLQITTFNLRDYQRFAVLNSLTVSGNRKINAVVNSSRVISILSMRQLDLSHNKISKISDNCFRAVPLLETLDLSGNNITYIKRLTFLGLNQLQQLNLSNNKLCCLENGSFDNFVNLKVLDLSRNVGLGYQWPISSDTFKHMSNLLRFFFGGNYNSGNSYPNRLFSELKNLTDLSIDLIGDNVTLAPEMTSLQQLTALDIECQGNGLSTLKNVSGSFLKHTPYLQTVRFNLCPIHHLDSTVYTHVYNLTTLQFSYTYPYSIFTALGDLNTLQNSSLTTLNLIGLVGHCPFIILSERHCRFLSNIPLETLDLSENRIGYIEEGFLQKLPLTLKRLLMRGNRLVEPRLLLSKISFLNNLQVLDLGTHLAHEQENPDDDKEYLDTMNELDDVQRNSFHAVGQSGVEDVCKVQMSNFSSLCLDWKNDATSPAASISPATMCSQYTSQSRNSVFQQPVQLPQNLRYLLATRFLEMNISGVFDIIAASKKSSLDEVDVSYCALPTFADRAKVPSNIKALNFEGNYFKKLSPRMFYHQKSLEFLTLADNALGVNFSEKPMEAFKGLKQVTYLDISKNLIFYLPSDFFSGLGNVKVVIAKDNKLHVLNTTFSGTPSLYYLDLKKNSIGWISRETRDELDAIRTSHPLYIDLSYNPLRCTCEGLFILVWIQTSNIHFLSSDFHYCHRYDGQSEYVGNVAERVELLKRQCLGSAVITVLSVAFVFMACLLIGFSLVYRYRWQLRYIRNIALSRLVGFKPRESTSSVYKYDAFIVYSVSSRKFVFDNCRRELEQKRGHKLCLDDRDFMPGTYDISAIVSAIQNSTKTVLMISPDFYDQQISEYSVKMALMEEIYQSRSVLYLCVYQPLADDQMRDSYDLLMLMKRNSYIEFPPETETSEDVRGHFWDSLSAIIGHSSATDSSPEAEPEVA